MVCMKPLTNSNLISTVFKIMLRIFSILTIDNLKCVLNKVRLGINFDSSNAFGVPNTYNKWGVNISELF